MAILKKLITFLPSQITKANHYLVINLPTLIERPVMCASKFTGVSLGSIQAIKGSIDLSKAISHKSPLCVVASSFGLAADAFQISSSFKPGAMNLVTLVTCPVSLGVKFVVWTKLKA